MRSGKTHLRPLSADAVDPRSRVGPKTLRSMRPIHAPPAVLEVFRSTPLEAIQRADGEVRLVKAGRRRKPAAPAALQRSAVVKIVPSGKHFVAIVDVTPAPSDPPER